MKQARMLQQVSERRESGLFVAEGVKVVKELLNSKIRVSAIMGSEEALSELRNVHSGDFYFSVKPRDLEYMSGLKTPNGVLAVAFQPERESGNVIPDSSCLMLDHIADPGNMGTIIRTAEWFGIKHIICSPESVDCWSPKVVQSAMGSLFRTTIIYSQLTGVLSSMIQSGSHRIIGASLGGGEMKKSGTRPFALVIGSESHGISQELLDMIPEKVLIPKSKSAETESLNAAVACGILLYSLNGQ
jgi:RNA methyltransferase, TrmH family